MISVIIPAYNAEAYIEQCAWSVLGQTMEDIEIIFIDDGSSDRTGEILDAHTKDRSSVIVVHQENKGLYKSREIGLSLAKGEYVGWVDADDFVEPDMFEILYDTAVEHDSELVICDYTCFPQENSIKGKWFREYKGKVDTTFVEQNSQVWNKIVKRDLLERLNIGPLFVSCFDEIYIRVLMEARNPVTIHQPLYHYRVGTGTMSTSYKDVSHYRGFVKASEELRDVMRPVVKDTYWKDYFDYRVAYYLLMTMLVAANAGNREAYEQNREELLTIKPSYNKNQHYWRTLVRNYGWLRAAILGGIVPASYGIAHLMCKVGFQS